MPNSCGYSLSIECILREAKFRWLKGYEVLCILQNYSTYGLQLSPAPPVDPSSGSLFLFNKRLVKFRKDGVNWRKQKDGKTVRESHEKLKVGGIKVLSCCYTRSADNISFQRRIYWLLDGDPNTVLVHYLLLDKDVSLRDDGCAFDQYAYDEYGESPRLFSIHLQNDNEESSNCSDFSDDENDFNNLPSINSAQQQQDSLMELVNSFITPNENGTCFSSDEKYTLPTSLSSVSETQDMSSSSVPNMLGRLAKITDFSPEWDYSEGGSKMLIMGPDFHSGLNYFCMFDQVEVPAELVQDGVLRCRIPNHYQPGVVSFCVTRGNYRLFSEVFNFEYRNREIPNEMMSMNDRTFKIKIIEKLERLEREVNAGNPDPVPLTDNLMDSLSATTNVDLTEEQLELVFVKILINLVDKIDNCETINAQDQEGYTLLHYACALRYHLLASTLLRYGVNVNIQDKSGSTPFHLAMKNRDQKMIKILVDYVDLSKTAYSQIDMSKLDTDFSPKQGRSPVEGIISGMDGLGLQLTDSENSQSPLPTPTSFRKLKESSSTHSSPRTPLKSRQQNLRKSSDENINGSPILAFKDYRVRRVERAEDDLKKRVLKARDTRVAEKRK